MPGYRFTASGIQYLCVLEKRKNNILETRLLGIGNQLSWRSNAWLPFHSKRNSNSLYFEKRKIIFWKVVLSFETRESSNIIIFVTNLNFEMFRKAILTTGKFEFLVVGPNSPCGSEINRRPVPCPMIGK